MFDVRFIIHLLRSFQVEVDSEQIPFDLHKFRKCNVTLTSYWIFSCIYFDSIWISNVLNVLRSISLSNNICCQDLLIHPPTLSHQPSAQQFESRSLLWSLLRARTSEGTMSRYYSRWTEIDDARYPYTKSTKHFPFPCTVSANSDSHYAQYSTEKWEKKNPPSSDMPLFSNPDFSSAALWLFNKVKLLLIFPPFILHWITASLKFVTGA